MDGVVFLFEGHTLLFQEGQAVACVLSDEGGCGQAAVDFMRLLGLRPVVFFYDLDPATATALTQRVCAVWSEGPEGMMLLGAVQLAWSQLHHLLH